MPEYNHSSQIVPASKVSCFTSEKVFITTLNSNHFHYKNSAPHRTGSSLWRSSLTKCFSSSQRDYPKSLRQCLQERGLSVEMLYLQVESGLTRALQDVRADGSPLCILVEQKNIALSSCTVIIFSESLKSKFEPLIFSSLPNRP